MVVGGGVGLSLPFFTPAVSIAARTDFILTIPKRLATPLARMASVRIMSAPREIKGYNYDMIWHPRLNDDPAHRWFREQVRILGKHMLKNNPVPIGESSSGR
jgi:DNA-binding transcriptional LysR family regulator